MNVLTRKTELIKWISSIEDLAILNEIEKIKQHKTFDFDKEFERGISGDELKKRTTQFIKTLPWGKQ